MDIIYIIVILAFLFSLIKKLKIGEPHKKTTDKIEIPESSQIDNTILPIAGAYQKKWILSYNEKDAFRKIKAITDEIGCYTFSKVRLLDLLEPIKGNAKYKTYFYKVQAKHVDFVILDSKLVARCIIELDDASHDSEERIARDNFVNDALQSIGYSVIHTRAITSEVEEQIKAIMN